MRTEAAEVGARGVDSLPFSQGGTSTQAHALKVCGCDFVVGYLGAMTAERLEWVFDAGLAFMPVTFAGEYFDGAVDELAQLKALSIPAGCTVWLDLEGQKAFATPAPELAQKINTWADAVKAGGFQPGLYVGSPQPFTSEELYALHVVRYWNALSRESDRNGRLAEPKCGWCMWQMHPSIMWRESGVWVDVNMIGKDFHNRLPNWVVG